MSKIIVLESIPDNFNPKIHVPISPLCFSGREEIYPNWIKLFDKEPFTTQEVEDVYPELSNYACHISEHIGEKLNEQYQLNHSKQYWKIVLYTYTELILNYFWIAEKYVKQILEKYRNQPIEICMAKEGEVWTTIPETTFDLYSLSQKIEFNFLVFSFILQKLGIPKTWKVTYKRPPLIEREINSSKISLKQHIENTLDVILVNYGHYKRKVYGFSVIDDILMGLLLRIKPAVSDNIIYKTPKITKIDSELDYMSLAEMLLPKCYQNAKHYKSKKIKSGKLKLGSNHLIWNEKYKIIIADAIEQGGRVLGHQHGSLGYGYIPGVIGNYPEYSLNGFITWGWSSTKQIKTSLNFISLPSPLLSTLSNRHKQINDNIILVGTLMPFVRTRLVDYALPWTYRQNKIMFLSNLKKSLRNNFYYRPYPIDYNSIKDKTCYTSLFSWLQIHTGNLHQDLLKCKLLILDHPGTTLNLAMSANTPLICTWHTEFINYSHESSDLQKLKDAKIIFDNPKDALEHLHQIEPDVQSWWQSDAVQTVRREWCEKYALTDKNWRKKWFEFIWNF